MVQGYTIDQIRQFHARNFGAARAHLYVAGVFDGAAANLFLHLAKDNRLSRSERASIRRLIEEMDE